MWSKKSLIILCSCAVLSFPSSPAFSAVSDTVTVNGSYSLAPVQPEVVKHVLTSTAAIAHFPVIDLGPVASVKVQTLLEQDSIPKQVGFSRTVAALSTTEDTAQQFQWKKLSGKGHHGGLEISSPQAVALRVAMTVDNLPADVEFRFYGKENVAVVNVDLVAGQAILDILETNKKADPSDPAGKYFWSPTVDGDTLGMEIYLPEKVDPSSLEVAFPLLSHISIPPFAESSQNYQVQDQGDADACQNDATCASSSWNNLRNSVAGMIFSTFDGTYICTGSLLNDADTTTTIPYFVTANHCIDRQSTASTLDTRWFWQSAVCNGSNLSPFYQRISGGAALLHTQGMSSGNPTSDSMDTTLLRLNSSPPGGAFYAGWTTDVPPSAGTSRTGIHHPKGDWKKISHGISGGDVACGAYDVNTGYFECYYGGGNFYTVSWTDGGTEGGSSGSGFYADQEHLIGTLTGGDGNCAGSQSVYSSFRAAYVAGNYGQWLNTAPEPPKPPVPVVAPSNFLLLR